VGCQPSNLTSLVALPIKFWAIFKVLALELRYSARRLRTDLHWLRLWGFLSLAEKIVYIARRINFLQLSLPAICGII